MLATIAEHTFPETDGLYIFLPHFWNRPAFYPDEPVKYTYTEAGVSIRDYSEVLKRIMAQSTKEAGLVQRYWPGTIVQRQFDAEFESDAAKELYGGSSVIIKSLEYRENERSASPPKNQEGEQPVDSNPH